MLFIRLQHLQDLNVSRSVPLEDQSTAVHVNIVITDGNNNALYFLQAGTFCVLP